MPSFPVFVAPRPQNYTSHHATLDGAPSPCRKRCVRLVCRRGRWASSREFCLNTSHNPSATAAVKMKKERRIALWEKGRGRARERETWRRWITGYCCCRPCRWIRPCSSCPWRGPRCSPRLGEGACARLCGPDPSPPRNWWSCAAEKSHGWLREKSERIRSQKQTYV